jgi:Flp pilus assembly protein TadB
LTQPTTTTSPNPKKQPKTNPTKPGEGHQRSANHKKQATQHKPVKTKIKRILSTTATIVFYGVLIYLSTFTPNIWGTLLMGGFFTALLIGTLYRNYRYYRANQKEKQAMLKQRPTNMHYYNKWYRPADSTELEYQRQKAEEEKKRISKK